MVTWTGGRGWATPGVCGGANFRSLRVSAQVSLRETLLKERRMRLDWWGGGEGGVGRVRVWVRVWVWAWVGVWMRVKR
jgi:hypothetical protein